MRNAEVRGVCARGYISLPSERQIGSGTGRQSAHIGGPGVPPEPFFGSRTGPRLADLYCYQAVPGIDPGGIVQPTRVAVMPTTISREVIWGQIMGAKMRARHDREAARKAAREAVGSNGGLEGYGGPAQPPPTVGQWTLSTAAPGWFGARDADQ
jgi:hypothetical protein